MFGEEEGSSDPGFNKNMMSVVVFPPFFPETHDFPHLDFSINIAVLFMTVHIANLLHQSICLDKPLMDFNLLAQSQMLMVIFLHLSIL